MNQSTIWKRDWMCWFLKPFVPDLNSSEIGTASQNILKLECRVSSVMKELAHTLS